MLFHPVFLYQMTRKLEEAKKLIQQLEREKQKLQSSNQDLQRNFSSLLLTARGEITRKEREINQLR